MWRFLTLFFLTAFVAADVSNIEGEWFVTKVFGGTDIDQSCVPIKLTAVDSFCKCGHDDHVQKVNFEMGTFKVAFPIMFSENFEHTSHCVHHECDCQDKKSPHYSFQKLNDNYYWMVGTDSGLGFTWLLSRTVKPAEEVNNFIKTVEFLKDKESYFICNSDIKENGGHTSEKKWYHGPKVHHHHH